MIEWTGKHRWLGRHSSETIHCSGEELGTMCTETNIQLNIVKTVNENDSEKYCRWRLDRKTHQKGTTWKKDRDRSETVKNGKCSKSNKRNHIFIYLWFPEGGQGAQCGGARSWWRASSQSLEGLLLRRREAPVFQKIGVHFVMGCETRNGVPRRRGKKDWGLAPSELL